MSWAWCGECGGYHRNGEHLPEWQVVDLDNSCDEDHEDNAQTVRGSDPEHAVERWANGFCDHDDIEEAMSGMHVAVLVDGKWKPYTLTGEYDIVWDAREVDE